MWVICKSAETQALIEEWVYWNLIDECGTVGFASLPNDWSFWVEEANSKFGHRYDQSISGLLLNRRGNWLVEWPDNLCGMSHYVFLQYSRLGEKYTFINSNITNSNFK